MNSPDRMWRNFHPEFGLRCVFLELSVSAFGIEFPTIKLDGATDAKVDWVKVCLIKPK